MALVDCETGEVIDTYTSLNHQRMLGTDVISRINASNNGKSDVLKQIIEKDLWSGIYKLVQGNNVILSKVIMVGNPTMIHLLMDYPCYTLGKYPFINEHKNKIQCKLKDCIKKSDSSKYKDIPTLILPALSAFVGADVIADVFMKSDFIDEKNFLMVDLGTNGEIVLGYKSKLLATSTAAGPAFEGGNISCGMASVPGSICQAKIKNRKMLVRTIKGYMPPIGICGTGLISVIAELRKNGILNEEGLLQYPFEKCGYPLWTFENGEKILLTQKDIREFQMAKSAIRVGIEILIEELGCDINEIQKVYIAGGFGNAMDVNDLVLTGIIPVELKNRIEIIGNGALQGCIKVGMDQKWQDKLDKICEKANVVFLAKKDVFQNKYFRHMNF